MSDARGEGAHRGDLPRLHQLFLMHLQFVGHPIEGPEQGREFFRGGLRLRNRGEITMGYLVHGLLHLEEGPHQHAGEIEGHQDAQGQEDYNRADEQSHGALEQAVDLEPFTLLPTFGNVQQLLPQVSHFFFFCGKIAIAGRRPLEIRFDLGQNFLIPGEDSIKLRRLGVFLQPQDLRFMAQVKLNHMPGIMPGLLDAGRLMVKEEILFKAAGLQQALKQVAGEFQQPQAMADFPVHLEAESREDQHCQDAEQKGQDDYAPDLIGGFFHKGFFSSWIC